MEENAIIGQFGGPTSVINSSLCGLIQEGLKSKKIKNILGMRNGIIGFMKDEIVDLGKEEPRVINALRQTPSSALGSCRYILKEEEFPLILRQLKKFNIRYFFLIGGNGSMGTLRQVEQYCKKNNYRLSGIGIPKTVDNDLCGTDHTPGFPSAARYVCLSVQQAGRLARDMQSVDKYVILQTVGRDTGWLAASAVLAKKNESDAPHLIYIPERPLSRERFISDVKECIEKYGWVSIVCGEGILWEDKSLVASLRIQDDFPDMEYGAMGGGSAALNLYQLIHQETNYRGEFQITESLSMCAIDRASKVDLEEAYACGIKAIKLAEEGASGIMVSIHRVSSFPYQIELDTVPLDQVAVKIKTMDDKYINAEGNFVTDDYIKYIKPLVGKLPNYSELNFIKYL
ncbi:MAG TPA: diphosphate--fructose-6-phosphate 1-phosphotransferase [Candidatus Atribacteria bacterium]|nr:diphosphate--fructose-6-phosphate 1-phosphotransferase [Candidatus Atribacteria bacterium]